MSNLSRTSDFYKTKNLPERFDNPGSAGDFGQLEQKCYMPGNPVFSCFPTQSQSAEENNSEIIEGYSQKQTNPIYKTSNMNYGQLKPNVHTMPTSYYSRSASFTSHLGKCGMYRNQSLNTAVTRSKV